MYQIWEPQPYGILRACPELYKDCFIFYLFGIVREQVVLYRIGRLYPLAHTVTVAVPRGTKKGTLHVKETCVLRIASYSKFKKGLVFLENFYLQ